VDYQDISKMQFPRSVWTSLLLTYFFALFSYVQLSSDPGLMATQFLKTPPVTFTVKPLPVNSTVNHVQQSMADTLLKSLALNSSVKQVQSTGGRVAISMGICIEARTRGMPDHDHSKKPYAHSAVLATRLWLQQDPKLIVIVLIAHTKHENVSLVVQSLTNAGATTWDFDVSAVGGQHACAQAAQLGRMFAFETGMLNDDDLMVTSDADAFPIKVQTILSEFKTVNREGNPYQVWASQYDYAFSRGHTIPATFVAMQCQTWRRVFKADFVTTLKMASHMEYYWGIDQTVLTARLWQSGLCTFPSGSAVLQQIHDQSRGCVWDFSPLMVDDSLTCHHGTGNRDKRQCLTQPPALSEIESHPCTWVHFLPTADAKTLDLSFENIRKVRASVMPSFLMSEQNMHAVHIVDYTGIKHLNFLLALPANIPLLTRADGDEAQQFIVDIIYAGSKCRTDHSLIVLDIGGLYGDFALSTAARGCHVMVWEPQKSHANEIRMSVSLNNFGNLVTVRNAAVGTINQSIIVGAHHDGQVSMKSFDHTVNVKNATIVVSERMDDVVKGKRVLFMKVDVEGFEGDVLASSSGLFQQALVDHAVWEYTPAQFEGRGTDFKDFIPSLYRLGAKKCFLCHRTKPLLFLIDPSKLDIVYQHLKAIRMQTDVYCAFSSIPDEFNSVTTWSTLISLV
jgi:FkbM family methyltransferase